MNRRALMAGLAAAGAVMAAGLYRFTDIFGKHYPSTPYDDLLIQLADREQAAKLGAAVRGTPDAQALAVRLRAGMSGDLAAAAEAVGKPTPVEMEKGPSGPFSF